MSDCNNCQFDFIDFKQDNSFIGNCTDRSDEEIAKELQNGNKSNVGTNTKDK